MILLHRSKMICSRSKNSSNFPSFHSFSHSIYVSKYSFLRSVFTEYSNVNFLSYWMESLEWSRLFSTGRFITLERPSSAWYRVRFRACARAKENHQRARTRVCKPWRKGCVSTVRSCRCRRNAAITPGRQPRSRKRLPWNLLGINK